MTEFEQLAKRLELVPPSRQQIETVYLPIAEKITTHPSPVVTGISGAPGSGKSTFAQFIKLILEKYYHRHCIIISLDDFYKSKAERTAMATAIHPLFQTRGVPGTHDTKLAIEILSSLKNSDKNSNLSTPVFDKSNDDRADQAKWHKITGKADIILFEGWCVGAPAQTTAELIEPVNYLEESEDHDGEWRRKVNYYLSHDYQDLFALIDLLIFLQIPSFDVVYKNRLHQEETLYKITGKKGMCSEEIKHFIQFYERLTKHCLKKLPAQADITLSVFENHIYEITKI